MRNYKIAAAAAAVMVLTLGMTAFAAEWKQEADGRWWYQQDDGSYPAGRWMKINGKQYYFDADGYMLSDTTTPDGYKVGADGAWIENGTSSGIQYSTASVWINSLTQTASLGSLKYYEPAGWRKQADSSTMLHYYPYSDRNSSLIQIMVQDVTQHKQTFKSEAMLDYFYKITAEGLADSKDNVISSEIITIGGLRSEKAHVKNGSIDMLVYITYFDGKVYATAFAETGSLSDDMIQFADAFMSKVSYTSSETGSQYTSASKDKESNSTIYAANSKVYSSSADDDEEESDTDTVSSSGSSGSTSYKNYYEKIYRTYKSRIEASHNAERIEELGAEGVNKMAEYCAKHPKTYSSYEKWAEKLLRLTGEEGADSIMQEAQSQYEDIMDSTNRELNSLMKKYGY